MAWETRKHIFLNTPQSALLFSGIAALDKLERLRGSWIKRIMFMCGGRIPHWLCTHPIMVERIARPLELGHDVHSSEQFGSGLAEFRDVPIVARAPRWHWSGLWY